jgi:hypothetical protein
VATPISALSASTCEAKVRASLLKDCRGAEGEAHPRCQRKARTPDSVVSFALPGFTVKSTLTSTVIGMFHDHLWPQRAAKTLNKKRDMMRKLTLAIALPALSIAACVAVSAQAAPRIALPSQNQSAIQQIGCTSAGPRCPLGRTWICTQRGCACAPCGVYYGAPWRYPLRPWRWRY